MRNALLIVTDLILILAITLLVIYQRDNKRQMDRIERKLEHRAKLDTMYWQHLEVCDFQLKDGINVVEY